MKHKRLRNPFRCFRRLQCFRRKKAKREAEADVLSPTSQTITDTSYSLSFEGLQKTASRLFGFDNEASSTSFSLSLEEFHKNVSGLFESNQEAKDVDKTSQSFSLEEFQKSVAHLLKLKESDTLHSLSLEELHKNVSSLFESNQESKDVDKTSQSFSLEEFQKSVAHLLELKESDTLHSLSLEELHKIILRLFGYSEETKDAENSQKQQGVKGEKNSENDKVRAEEPHPYLFNPLQCGDVGLKGFLEDGGGKLLFEDLLCGPCSGVEPSKPTQAPKDTPSHIVKKNCISCKRISSMRSHATRNSIISRSQRSRL